MTLPPIDAERYLGWVAPEPEARKRVVRWLGDVQLIAQLPQVLAGLPETAVLVGASRKRVVGMWCGNPPFEERLPGTLAIHTLAQWNGAHILRVHDVAPAVQAARVADACRRER